ncbi:hypothetical protein Fcan01_06484 [Folsomia candida]|uniref:Uncharacterized protein n=1 Tax=Folsomia candida TaxID=158441 RepID=A0A226EJX2_FOLCA|nr:hypothetical protein Fcan01_06484 [Folsomia candida]
MMWITTDLHGTTAKRRLDIKEDIENHTTCQGVKIEVPADIMLSFIGAAAQCLAFEDEFLCTSYNYHGMIKANKIDMEFLRNEAKKFSLPDPETQKRFDQLVDAVEICAVILGDFEKPNESNLICAKAQTHSECMEKRFQEVCNPPGV